MSAATRKISIALGSAEEAWAKKRAKRLKTSVSSIITEAVRVARQMDARRDVLQWLGGPVSERERESIRKEWA
jgi:hypothetical protein